MLTHRVAMPDSPLVVELQLSGKEILMRRLQPQAEGSGWDPGDLMAKALWSFEHQEIDATFEGFPDAMVPVANRVFSAMLKELDRPRQTGLFGEKCCSVCGADKVTYPESIIRDGYGNPMETRGEIWKNPDSPVEWPCHVCERLVCRKCALTRTDGQLGLEEYYSHTYCSEACRAAAPPSFAADDENMR